MRLFSTEQVSKYHPDKICDQISDAVLDACLKANPQSRVACECMAKGSMIILAGEITGVTMDFGAIASSVAGNLRYYVDRVLTWLDYQSPEIAKGVDAGGAGDQGMMYGYATAETDSLLPYGFDLANRIIAAIEDDTENNPKTLFSGDAKCQVTVDLDEPDLAQSVRRVLVSVCHRAGLNETKQRVKDMLYDLGIDEARTEIIINPAGIWTIGGPAADCGLTGRKIVCDQYGGYCPVGGGAFSGKDPTKVDRSGAYMARKIACDALRRYDLDKCEVQLAYAIGMPQPVSVSVMPKPKGQASSEDAAILGEIITEWVTKTYDLSPRGIITELDLLNRNYEKLAGGCHFRKGGIGND
ncbi:MAG: methionine adenosyltransferase domain-containing protein [Clostridia bacterium]|nr:methionine adenosyltransferase domain-containing protein [Clostridia bacterium]